jgi:hypothetical protein
MAMQGEREAVCLRHLCDRSANVNGDIESPARSHEIASKYIANTGDLTLGKRRFEQKKSPSATFLTARQPHSR